MKAFNIGFKAMLKENPATLKRRYSYSTDPENLDMTAQQFTNRMQWPIVSSRTMKKKFKS